MLENLRVQLRMRSNRNQRVKDSRGDKKFKKVQYDQLKKDF